MLWSLLSDHRAKLRTWLSASLERLTNAYEAQAAPFRDRLRAAGDGQPGEGEAPAEPIEELEADLKLLRQIAPAKASEVPQGPSIAVAQSSQ